MTDTSHHPGCEQTAEQQSAEIGGNDKSSEAGGKTFDLGTHPEQGHKQAIGEQQQSVAEQNRTERDEGFIQGRSGTGHIPGSTLL